jgi:probable rRNA maturation factor
MEQVAAAVLSISIVDNAAIHSLNRDHLQHDYPTDVISFQLDFSKDDDQLSELPAAGASIEGEIIACAEMAASMAADGQWSVQDELTLYVIHGLLHICGYDDLNPDDKDVMRSRERTILSSLGLTAVYSEDVESGS